MRRDERLLKEIQRFVGIAAARPQQAKDRLTVPTHDLGESGLPAAEAERSQIGVRQHRMVEAHEPRLNGRLR